MNLRENTTDKFHTTFDSTEVFVKTNCSSIGTISTKSQFAQVSKTRSRLGKYKQTASINTVNASVSTVADDDACLINYQNRFEFDRYSSSQIWSKSALWTFLNVGEISGEMWKKLTWGVGSAWNRFRIDHFEHTLKKGFWKWITKTLGSKKFTLILIAFWLEVLIWKHLFALVIGIFRYESWTGSSQTMWKH